MTFDLAALSDRIAVEERIPEALPDVCKGMHGRLPTWPE